MRTTKYFHENNEIFSLKQRNIFTFQGTGTRRSPCCCSSLVSEAGDNLTDVELEPQETAEPPGLPEETGREYWAV